MAAYVIRKLMYMPFILLGVIFITFVLFQMSTTPESLAKIQLGEKASALQIYEWLESKGQVSWTEAGEEKRKLLADQKLNYKRTEFFVAGKLEEFAEQRDDLHNDIVDAYRDSAELEAEEREEFEGDANNFRRSEDLEDAQQELGRMQKRLLENRIHVKETLLAARQIQAELELSEEEAVEVRALDGEKIELEFLQKDVELITQVDHEQLEGELKEARTRVKEAEAALNPKLKESAAWKKYKPIREELADVTDIEPDLTYTPFFVNFAYYLRDIAMLDFGDTNKRRPVIEVIKEGMWPSLALAIPGFFLAEIIGVFFGLFAAMYRQTRIDHVIVVSAILLMSVNGIALIMFGQKFMAADWNYFPITGYAEGFGAVRFLMLPILLYVMITLGERIRFNRIVMLDETNQDYVRTARAKGVSENGVLFKHIFRNTLIPLITRWVVAIPTLYLGSLVLESFFSIPGLGYLTVEAISNSDANVIRAVVVFGSVSFMLAALLSDVLYAVVDPRVKLS